MSCQEKVTKVLAEIVQQVKDSDVKKVFKEVDDLKKNNPMITEQELINRVIDKRKSYLFKKARVLKQVTKGEEHMMYIDKAAALDGVTEDNMKDAIRGLISRNGKYQALNIESQYATILGEYSNTLKLLNSKDYLRILRDKNNSPEFFREVAQGVWAKSKGIKFTPKFSQSAEAIDIIHGLNKKRLLDLQNAGYDVQELTGYVFSGTHDPMLLRKFGEAEFIKDAMAAIDVDAQIKKLGSSDIEGFLKGVYKEVVYSDRGEVGGLENLSEALKEMKNPDRVNKMVSSHRAIMYRDGQSFYNFFEKYSGNNLMESVMRDSKRTARIVAQTNVFGTAPEIGIDQLIQAANTKLTAANLRPLGKDFRNELSTTINMALGRASVSDSLVVRAANVAKQISTNALLGKAAVKAMFTDPVMAANVLSTLTRDNYFVAMTKYANEYAQMLASTGYKDEVAKRSGLIMKDIMHDFAQENMGISGFERGMSKMTDMFITVSGLRRQSNAARAAAAKITFHHLADIFEGRIGKELADADLASLKAYGFSDNDLALMKAGVGDLQGTRIMDPSVIHEMEPAKIREVLGNPTRTVKQVVTDETLKSLEQELKDQAAVFKSLSYKKGGLEQINYANKVLNEAKQELVKTIEQLSNTPLGKQVETLRLNKQRLFARIKQEKLAGKTSPEKLTELNAELSKLRSLYSQAESNFKNSAQYKVLDDIKADIQKKRQFRNELQEKLGNAEEIKAAKENYKKIKETYESSKAGLERLRSGDMDVEEALVMGDKWIREVQKPLDDRELIGMARNTAQKASSYAQDYALMASPSPTAVIQYKMAGMRDPSTPAGALISLVMQFKAFGASVYRVYRNTAWHSGRKETNKFKQYLYGGRGAIAYTMLTGTAMGAFVNMLSDVLDGKTPRDPTAEPLDFLQDAIMASGTGGLYMDYILEDYEQGRKDIAKDMLGPVAGRMIPDAFQIYQELGKAATGDDNRTIETAINKLTRWMPGQNLWFGKPMLDMLFLENMRQWADPLHEAKRAKFMKERSGDLWQQQPIFED